MNKSNTHLMHNTQIISIIIFRLLESFLISPKPIYKDVDSSVLFW